MSASTVSVTANPAAASRRRPVLIGEKKSVLDMASSDEIATSPATGGAGSKYLSQSVRADVLERSRDAVQIKNPLPTNSAPTLPRRTTARKGGAASSSSSSKPRWKTVVSVFTKNLVLLLILLLLAQMIRRLAFNQGNGDDAVLAISSDYERRISEVEAFLKTSTKVMQARIDMVDQKIENEVTSLKTELSKKLDDNGGKFSSQLGELDARVESMEKSLASSNEWLQKDEFDKFLVEFKEAKGFDNNGDLKLDEIRAFAREIVEKEIEKHAADGVGRVDYAVASGGAFVLEHSKPFVSVGKVSSWLNPNVVSSDAVKMLKPSFGEPGACFALNGNTGFVTIKLRTAIVPEAVTLEHVAKSVAFDRSSAPKDCKVYGWSNNEDMHLLAEFDYDLEKTNAQTFNVESSKIINKMRLEFTSNHGSLTHTCIYRLRVHGREP